MRASSPQGRFAEGAALLDGLTLLGADAWGKYLFCNFDSGDVLHVHLGLIGKFRALKAPIPDPVGAVRLRIQNAATAWDLSGPTRCDIISPIEQEQIWSRLGADPLRSDGAGALRARIGQNGQTPQQCAGSYMAGAQAG